jgi:hypothetical protein
MRKRLYEGDIYVTFLAAFISKFGPNKAAADNYQVFDRFHLIEKPGQILKLFFHSIDVLLVNARNSGDGRQRTGCEDQLVITDWLAVFQHDLFCFPIHRDRLIFNEPNPVLFEHPVRNDIILWPTNRTVDVRNPAGDQNSTFLADNGHLFIWIMLAAANSCRNTRKPTQDQYISLSHYTLHLFFLSYRIGYKLRILEFCQDITFYDSFKKICAFPGAKTL